MPFAQMQRRIGRKVLRSEDPGRRAGRCCWPTICWNGAAKTSANGRSNAAARATRGSRRCARFHRPNRALRAVPTSATWEELAEAAPKHPRTRSRRIHAEAARFALPRRTPPGRLVEMEDRTLVDRLRADLRAARQRPPRQPAYRLHFRRLGQRGAGAVR